MHFGILKYKQKGSAAIFLLIAIVLLAFIGGMYYLSRLNPAKEPVSQAANVKNIKKGINFYSNQNLKLEFQYNQGLTVKEDSEEEFNKRGGGDFRKNFKGYIEYEPGKFVGAVAVLDKEGSFDTNPFTVWIFENPQNLTIDDWHHQYWYYPFVWGDFTDTGKFILAPKDEATISGQMGKSGIIDYREGKPKFIYLPKDQKMYLFRIIGENGDKILSTFKFI